MVKHIKSTQWGQNSAAVYSITLEINGQRYLVDAVTPEDYQAYRVKVSKGEGFNAIHFLRDRGYELIVDEPETSEDIQYVHNLVQDFMSQHYPS